VIRQPKDKQQVRACRYQLWLPTESDLREEFEHERADAEQALRLAARETHDGED